MATGGKDRTVLWNPIGSGINSEMKEADKPYRELTGLKNIVGYTEFTKEIIKRIYSKFILENGWVSPAILEEDAKDKIFQIFEEVDNEADKISKKSLVKLTEPMEVLYCILLTTYLYNDDYEHHIDITTVFYYGR